MTRETKIGLLVGLAFIIVIGILLSDHMTASNEIPQANLNSTGNSVREGLTAPAPRAEASTGATVIITQPVTPREPVRTARELSPQPIAAGTPGESIVHVGPGSSVSPIQIHPSAQQPPATPEQIAANPTPTGPASVENTAPGHEANVPPGISELANTLNEPLVAAGAHPETPAANAAVAGTRHVAEAGDNLSRLASKYLGSSGKAARDAIVKANPSLAADPNKIIVGHTYIIPAPAAIAAAPAAAGPIAVTPAGASPLAPKPTATVAPAVGAAVDPNTVWYTVKENDSLWSIAAEQLGSGTKYTDIKSLNKDVLKNGDTVTVNMRLQLPAKQPVASAR